VLGDYGGDADNNAFSSLWEALPSVAVVGGQVITFTITKHEHALFVEVEIV